MAETAIEKASEDVFAQEFLPDPTPLLPVAIERAVVMAALRRENVFIVAVEQEPYPGPCLWQAEVLQPDNTGERRLLSGEPTLMVKPTAEVVPEWWEDYPRQPSLRGSQLATENAVALLQEWRASYSTTLSERAYNDLEERTRAFIQEVSK